MKKVILALALCSFAIAVVVVAPAFGASGTTTANGFKFPATINAPWAQGGEDDVINDPDPTAAGICRSSLFATNPYGLTSNVDVITNDPVNSSGVSNFHCQTPQNETSVAVNPTNALNLVAGANDYRPCCDFTGLNDGTGWAYVSRDGGLTWTDVQVPGLTAQTGGQGNFKRTDSAGDPALAFAPDGTLYYANIVFSRVSMASGVAVSVSKDGGLTWSAPSMVAYDDSGVFFNDKEWIAGGKNGTAVVTWTRFNQGAQGLGYKESPIVMAVTRNYGQSWNNQGSPVSDNAHPFNQGSQPVFAPDGTLYVAYEGASAPAYQTDATIVARSTDLGQHFTQTEVGRVYDDLDCYPVFAGRQTLSGEHFRLNSYPSFSIDPTNGQLAIVWADDQGAGNCGTGAASFTGTTSNVVKLVTSADGKTFTAPRTVVAAGDTVFPAVGANHGKIVVSYYTRAYSPTTAVCRAITGAAPGAAPVLGSGPVCLDYAAKTSTDGFATETRLTTESSNPFVEFADGSFIGDYSQVAVGSDGVAHPVWTDFRGNPAVAGTTANQDVYTQRFAG